MTARKVKALGSRSFWNENGKRVRVRVLAGTEPHLFSIDVWTRDGDVQWIITRKEFQMLHRVMRKVMPKVVTPHAKKKGKANG